MSNRYYGRLITQSLFFLLMVNVIGNVGAKSTLCTQTSIIESVVEDISDHIGGCTVCDTLSSIDSKIDALSPSSCDFSVIESIVESISNKIGDCTVCDQLSI